MLDRLSANLAENLAENLRRLREARGLTQQELSDASGVPRPTLAHLESGSANPTLLVLSRVAAALGVAMEELVATRPRSLSQVAQKELPEREHGGARVRELSNDAPSGLCVERIELEVQARLDRSEGRKADLTYVACEKGTVDVVFGGEHCTLHVGDVAVMRRGARCSFTNRARGVSILYSVRVAVGAA